MVFSPHNSGLFPAEEIIDLQANCWGICGKPPWGIQVLDKTNKQTNKLMSKMQVDEMEKT